MLNGSLYPLQDLSIHYQFIILTIFGVLNLLEADGTQYQVPSEFDMRKLH